MVLIMAVLGISITSYAGTSDEEAAKAETLINYYRLANGHAAIAVDETLTDAAKTRAAETAIYNSHYRPDGTHGIPLMMTFTVNVLLMDLLRQKT